MSKYLQAFRALALMAFVIQSAVSAEEFNGTIYRVGLSQVEVSWPVNASRVNLTIHETAANMTLLDEGGRMVGINSSYTFWRGDHNYDIAFEKHVSGRLIYSIPHQGQQFILPLQDGGPVRVILPPGYATGNHILGIARPDPDEMRVDKGGTALTWQNASRYQIIEISYYQEKAPEALMRILAVLVAAAVILLVEYYASIRKLRAIREDVERRA
jgi:hypothetical protein